jgi:hypothetical protein
MKGPMLRVIDVIDVLHMCRTRTALDNTLYICTHFSCQSLHGNVSESHTDLNRSRTAARGRITY